MNETDNAVEKKKNSKMLILIAVLATVVAGIVFFLVSYANSPDKKLSKQLELGHRYLIEEDYERAIAAFDVALSIDPKNVEAYLGKADAYVGLGNYDEAINVLAQGYSETSDETIKRGLEKVIKEYIETLVNSGEIEKASSFVKDIQEQISGLLDAYYIRDLQEMTDKSPSAEEVYSDYRELNILATNFWVRAFEIGYDSESVMTNKDFANYLSYCIDDRIVDTGIRNDLGSIYYISTSDANDMLHECLYGDVELPEDLDEIIYHYWGTDLECRVYYGDGGYYIVHPGFGYFPVYAFVDSVGKTEAYHYKITYKTFEVDDWAIDMVPDDFYNLNLTAAQTDSIPGLIFPNELCLDVILTDDGYRVYKQILSDEAKDKVVAEKIIMDESVNELDRNVVTLTGAGVYPVAANEYYGYEEFDKYYPSSLADGGLIVSEDYDASGFGGMCVCCGRDIIDSIGMSYFGNRPYYMDITFTYSYSDESLDGHEYTIYHDAVILDLNFYLSETEIKEIVKEGVIVGPLY